MKWRRGEYDSDDSSIDLNYPEEEIIASDSSDSTGTPDSVSEEEEEVTNAEVNDPVAPYTQTYYVQCSICFKWRLVPTEEKFEEIREKILAEPFLCETAREWRPDISCNDLRDISQDGNRVWAIDTPGIPRPPPSWKRLCIFRTKGSKFADVYYVPPSGKRLRSMVEIKRYLDEHPECKNEGVCLSRFSFQIPRPLQDDYVRRRAAAPAVPNDVGDHIPPPEVAQLTWVSPDTEGPASKRRRMPPP